MSKMICAVCGSAGMKRIFHHEGEFSFTSAQQPTSVGTMSVYQCANCSHVQTPAIENIEQYYDTAYNFQLDSDDTDDLYAYVNGKNVYRSDHQLAGLLAKIDFSEPKRVLDFGCAKAPTLRKLKAVHPNVEPFVFDVSDSYKPYWDVFVPPANQAPYRLPDDWLGTMDVVLSFFALEHTADAKGFLNAVASALRAGGTIHLVVPDMYANINDILVIDHVNHFSALSLVRLFASCGFEDIRIDNTSHNAAYIINATRSAGPVSLPERDAEAIAAKCAEAQAIADECSALAEKIRKFEKNEARGKAAIYGSGIYGMFILTNLQDRTKLVAFLDQNPHKQGKELLGVPVVAPSGIPEDVETLYVGLNPKSARSIISEQSYLQDPPRRTLFL